MAKNDKSKDPRDGDDPPRRPPGPRAKLGSSYISKGQMLRRMDRLAAEPGVMRLALQALLEHPETPMLEIGRTHRYVRESELETQHVGADWFDTEAGWFRGYGPVEPVLRAGFIQAARVALESDPPLPVDCYWMSNHDRIEVVVTRSPRQVTMILMTPQPQMGEFAPGEESVEEDIWIVGMSAGPSPVPGVAIQRVRISE